MADGFALGNWGAGRGTFPGKMSGYFRNVYDP
jgi:hypothetical protein